MRVQTLLILPILCVTASPVSALPAQGLYFSVLDQTRTPSLEFVMGEGILQVGYVPEPQLAERIWYGSLRLPISLVPEGKWWPGLKLLGGYHRQQTPVGTPFQAAEAGLSFTKELPLNASLYGFASLAQSLNGLDRLTPLVRAELGLAWKASRGTRVFIGYQKWQSPVGLSAGLTSLTSSHDLSGIAAGIDFQLVQLAGFSGDE